MKVKYRHLFGDHGAKQITVEVADNRCNEMMQRLFYSLEVYATPKHDYKTCDCHGCYLVRVVIGIVGIDILNEVHRN